MPDPSRMVVATMPLPESRHVWVADPRWYDADPIHEVELVGIVFLADGSDAPVIISEGDVQVLYGLTTTDAWPG